MRTTFSPGTKVTSAWLNAMQSPIFDDQELDGHFDRIKDGDLSNEPGQLKQSWTNFNEQFLVKNSIGLSVTINGGVFTNSMDIATAVPPSGLSVPPSSLTYIWITETGSFASGTNLPVASVPIAAVTTTPSSITSIVDLRPRFRFGPQSRAIAVFGGRGGSSLNYTTNTIVDGVINCTNFTLNAGVTLTVPSGFLSIVASGNVSINGTINVAPPIGGGFLFSGEVYGPQLLLPDAGKGFGGGAGHNATGGRTYPLEASPFGSGGAAGLTVISPGGRVLLTTSRGGNGGGSLRIDAGGEILISGLIACDGGAAVAGSIANLISGDVWITGAGAGSGGSIDLRSLKKIIVSQSGSLSVRGGNGANGVLSNNAGLSVGGGAGGGGRIRLASSDINITGATLMMASGIAGSNAGGAASGVNGSPGGGFGGSGGNSGGVGGSGQLSLFNSIAL